MTTRKIASVLFLVCLVGFLLFFEYPRVSDGRKVKRGAGRKVKLHKATVDVNPKLDHIPFDPEVAEAEQRHDDELWEKEYFRHHEEEMARIRKHQELEHLDPHAVADGAKSAENAIHDGHVENHEEEEEEDEPEYLEENENFDISERLKVLFPLVDTNPSDGFITEQELKLWLVNQAKKMSLHRTDRELEITDKNKDGFVSLKEYLHDDSAGDDLHLEIPDDLSDWRHKAEKQFPLADSDGNGKLDKVEFNDFSHPEDSENTKLHQFLREEELRHRDKDHDGKLTFQEFFENLFDEVYEPPEFEHFEPHHLDHPEKGDEKKAREMFHNLDTNNDGYITEDELQPVMYHLVPGEQQFAHDQATHMMTEADANQDGKLTLEEMTEHPDTFYNMAQEEEDYHDEF